MSQPSVTYFISYSRDDSEFALKLAQDLRAAGAHIWMDRLDIRMGERWDRKVEQALRKCAGLILIMSPTSVESDNVLDELDYALEKKKQILPILYRDCERPFRIRRRHFVDFTGTYDSAFSRVKRDLNLNPSTSSNPQIPESKKPKSGFVDDKGMVFVEGGTFQMGDLFDEGRDDEKPVHEVTLSDFWMGQHAVTFYEYDAFCEATGVEKPEDEGWGRGDLPVINVSWDDALAYCNWRSRQEGIKEVYRIDGANVSPNWKAKGYRLPTEAEWEFAARERGKKVRFGNGKDVANPNEMNFHASNIKRTVPVGEFPPNGLGLHQMSGNVWEWCWDGHGEDYYRSSNQARDPKGPSSGKYRVLRGGSWLISPIGCRVSDRNRGSPDYRLSSLGFRVARNF